MYNFHEKDVWVESLKLTFASPHLCRMKRETLWDLGRFRRLVGGLIYLTIIGPVITCGIEVSLLAVFHFPHFVPICQYALSSCSKFCNNIRVLKFHAFEKWKDLYFTHGHLDAEAFTEANQACSWFDWKFALSTYCMFDHWCLIPSICGQLYDFYFLTLYG